MHRIINDIVKSNATFATSSKWSDTVASNFKDEFRGQLYGYTEI